MGQRGRPRKHKKREPNGRGSRAEAARQNREFAIWQRRHVDVSDALKAESQKKKGERRRTLDELLLDPLAGSPFSQLLLNGHIGRQLHDAGLNYRRIVIRYKIACGLPLGLPSRLGIRGVDNSELPEDVIRACRRRYSEARSRLMKAGEGVLEEVDRVVIQEEEQPDIRKVRRGLLALLD